ncbi:MAG: TIGR03984 family CRISPR-associated protein [Ardenticatenaceae bacterium]|nr:TIGR03984 family CRISPR-associated protein [Ardenticatenaceae bacterium]MCB9445601.1 TIGR03984 family CRISPR-associated protein [Ardenticatenaceae bacterium]
MSWQVTIQKVQTEMTTAKKLTLPVVDWLAKQGSPYRWLLAHTFDGIIWGRLDVGGWQLSSGMLPSSPQFIQAELLELRLFGATSEAYVWRDGADLYYRTILDGSGVSYDYYDETYILWGTSSKPAKNDFTILSDGAQGLRHAVPFKINMPEGNGRPARLIMRHYIERHKETGLARIKMSRLQALQPTEEE